jgi:Bacterial TSP3 repeat
MKSTERRKFCIVALTSFSMLAAANTTAQPQVQFSRGLEGTYNADWEGVAGRTYFMQFSMNLVDWQYAPFMHFGDGGHHRGIHSDSDKFFLRLQYGDFEGIDNLDAAMYADFDGDGVSNIAEVTFGYDPFQTTSTLDGPDASLDPDGDGLSNMTEQAAGTNLMQRDHPAVQLEVTID